MACIYCGMNGEHHYRCPLYEPPKASHYCSICHEEILNGEEYIENLDGEYAHWDCVDYGRDLAKWLCFDIKTMENDYEK